MKPRAVLGILLGVCLLGHRAIGAGVPLVPAAIRGTERLTALRRWRIAFGAPIAPAEPPEPARPRALTDRLWSEILQLEAELWDRKH